jgi:hypothetical protein
VCSIKAEQSYHKVDCLVVRLSVWPEHIIVVAGCCLRPARVLTNSLQDKMKRFLSWFQGFYAVPARQKEGRMSKGQVARLQVDWSL